MDFIKIIKLAEGSMFNPVIPASYISAENLWAQLLDQVYKHDKSCIDKRSVSNKTHKRFQMLVKLVQVYEDTIWRPQHAEIIARSMLGKKVNIIHQEDSYKNSIEIDKELAKLSNDLNTADDRMASTEDHMSQLQQDLESRAQMIMNMQGLITDLSNLLNKLSKNNPRVDAIESIPKKQICVFNTENGGTAEHQADVTGLDFTEPPLSQQEVRSPVIYPVIRTLEYTPTSMGNTIGTWSQDCKSGWEVINSTPVSVPSTNGKKDLISLNQPLTGNDLKRTKVLLEIIKEILKSKKSVQIREQDISGGVTRDRRQAYPEYHPEAVQTSASPAEDVIRVCYKCRQKGHIRRNCPKQSRSTTGNIYGNQKRYNNSLYTNRQPVAPPLISVATVEVQADKQSAS